MDLNHVKKIKVFNIPKDKLFKVNICYVIKFQEYMKWLSKEEYQWKKMLCVYENSKKKGKLRNVTSFRKFLVRYAIAFYKTISAIQSKIYQDIY